MNNTVRDASHSPILELAIAREIWRAQAKTTALLGIPDLARNFGPYNPECGHDYVSGTYLPLKPHCHWKQADGLYPV